MNSCNFKSETLYQFFQVQLIWDSAMNCDIGFTSTYCSIGTVDLTDGKKWQIRSYVRGQEVRSNRAMQEETEARRQEQEFRGSELTTSQKGKQEKEVLTNRHNIILEDLRLLYEELDREDQSLDGRDGSQDFESSGSQEDYGDEETFEFSIRDRECNVLPRAGVEGASGDQKTNIDHNDRQSHHSPAATTDAPDQPTPSPEHSKTPANSLEASSLHQTFQDQHSITRDIAGLESAARLSGVKAGGREEAGDTSEPRDTPETVPESSTTKIKGTKKQPHEAKKDKITIKVVRWTGKKRHKAMMVIKPGTSVQKLLRIYSEKYRLDSARVLFYQGGKNLQMKNLCTTDMEVVCQIIKKEGQEMC